MNKILLPGILVLAEMFFSAGCFNECRSKPGSNDFNELVKTLARDDNAAAHRFSEFSADKQITIFLYARNCADDPRIRPMLVRNGKEKIADITERIGTEEKIWDKAELAGVLIAINTECRCILRDSETITKLEQIGTQLDADPEIPADNTYKLIYKENVKSLKNQFRQERTNGLP